MNWTKRQLVIFSLIFSLILISISFTILGEDSTPQIIINKTELFSDEKVIAEITPSTIPLSEMTLTLQNEEDTFKYFGIATSTIEFFPRKEGTYRIILSDKNNILSEKEIQVKKREYKTVDDGSTSLRIDKTSYVIDEEVRIGTTLAGEDISAIIMSSDTTFKYLGVPQNFSFYPRTGGLYEVRLLRGQEVLARGEFLVMSNNVDSYNILEETNETGPTTVNAGDENIFRVHDSAGRTMFLDSKIMKSFETGEEVLEVYVNTGSVKKISFKDLKTPNPMIGIEDVPLENLELEGERVVAAYAIDPQSLNFTNASVTATAKGNALYKCRDWSFLSQSCLGSWVKISELTPGTNYNFTITPDDPGFIETGVATINSRKPIYHPGETAEILMAVLNSSGYLVSGAEVFLTIISPDNLTYEFSNSPLNGTIEEFSYGLYSQNFTDTLIEGNYTLIVRAKAPNVNISMESGFLVQSFYEFDILRDAPMSVDPWSGPFTSTINISTYLNESGIESLTLIESVPLDFNITNSSGATVIVTPVNQQIMWENISSFSSFSYEVQPSLVTPDLKQLGPAVLQYYITNDTNARFFWEARPWYIAIDPTILVNNTACGEMVDQDPLAWTFGGACQGGTRLNINDGTTEAQRAGTAARYCGIRVGFQQTLTKCDAITNLTVAVEWWGSAATIDDCQGVWVSKGGTGGPWTQIAASTGHCTTTSNPGIRYYDVTNLLNATCADVEAGNIYSRLAMSFDGNRNCLEDYYVLNITYTQHLTGPTFSNESRNVTAPIKNESVRFNITINDEKNMSSWIFSWNLTGSWVNISSGNAPSGSGMNFTVNTTLQINANKSTNVCYKWYANDTFNNWNESATYCFIIANTAPTHSMPVINTTNNENTTNEDVYCWPQNGFDNDNDNITYYYSWYNDSGIISGENDSMLSKNYLSAGMNITCQVTPFDGVENGTALNSSKMLILLGTDVFIYLMSPVDEYVVTGQNITFFFNVSGSESLGSCELVIDGVNVSTKTSDLDFDTPLNISYDFGVDNTYLWSINCTTQSSVESNSSFRNLTINFNNDYPNITLNSPPDSSTQYGESQSFNCTSTDDGDIASVNFFSNSSGVWKIESTTQYSGFRQANVTSVFSLSDLPDKLSFVWNCQAVDYDNKKAFASADYSVFIDLQKPNVTLDSPINYWYDLNGNVTVNCTGYDNLDIANITLYTNAFGAWSAYQTVYFPASANISAKANFTISNIPYGTEFRWNCLAVDNESYSSFAESNYTITVVDEGTPYFATANAYGTNGWSTPQYATLAPDDLYSSRSFGQNDWLYTYDYSGLPDSGTLLGSYLSLRWYVTARVNDDLELGYSNNSGTNWYDLDGTAYSGADTATSYPTSFTNHSYLISGPLNISQLSTVRLRIWGVPNGGSDGTIRVDSLFLRLQYSPAPTYSDILKNDSIVYQNESVQFNTTWAHNIKLGCFIFYINQSGVFQNSACIDMGVKSYVASINWTINATPGSIVQWYFWANDTFGKTNQTPLQVFVVSDPNDPTPPVVNSVNVSPTTGSSGTVFNITANITDNIGVTSALAEITWSNGTKTNYSMSSTGSALWNYLFTSTMGGDHFVTIHAFDGGNNNVTSSPTGFNVTSYMGEFNNFYGRGESVNIVGYGFSSNSGVSLTIKDPSGAIVYSATPTSNSAGVVSATYSIPSSLITLLGDYVVELNDTTFDYLDASSSFLVIKRVDEARVYDNLNRQTNIITTSMLDSDNVTVEVRGRNGANPTYLNMSFKDTMQAGYNMTSLKFYWEHIDYDPESDNTVFNYWNGTSWVAATCSPIAFNGSWTISVCDLTADLASIPDKTNIRLMFDWNPTNDVGNQLLADIDFLGLWANWTIGNDLAVTIISPDNTDGVYDFNDYTNNNAYYGETTTDAPPPAPPALQGTEASVSEYSDLEANDETYWQTTTLTNNRNGYQTYYFTVDQQLQDIVSLDFFYNGVFTRGSGTPDTGATNFRIYIYNINTGSYTLLSANPITESNPPEEETQLLSIPTPYSNYINTTNGRIILLAISDSQGNGGPTGRIDIFTDYAALQITRITTISGFYPINVTAIDGDQINNCTYHFRNDSAYNYPSVLMSNTAVFFYYNLSNTSLYPDTYYNITANCSDLTGQINDTESIRVRVVNAPPSAVLKSPVNETNFTSSRNVTFIWNATTNTGQASACNMYLDGIVNVSDIIAVSGQNTSTTIDNIADGNHTWKVSCSLAGGTSNITDTWRFYVDLTPPTITLGSPASLGYEPNSTVNFTFTPSDYYGIDSCELIVDNAVVNTSTSITKGSLNALSYSGLAEGNHTWSVNCTDSHSFEGNSSKRTFYVDLTDPRVNISYPTIGLVLIGGTVQFNYTAYDNLAATLYCNITVNGIVLDSNILTTNATPKLRTVNVGDGFKYWNVTCADLSGRQNTSETWNFTVQGDPTVTLISPKGVSTKNGTNLNFTYYAGHSQGIKNCSLYIDSLFNESSTGVANYTNNYFLQNFTVEKLYLWTVLCYSNNDFFTMALDFNFTLDMTSPNTTLLYPAPDASFLSSSIRFNYTVTDSLDASLTCNLTINGVVSATNKNIVSQNNTLKSVTETVPLGYNYWQVVCWDDAGNINVSETRYLMVGDKPAPTLVSPSNNTFSKGNASFKYYVNDSSGIENCSLYINGVFNTSDTSPVNGANNTINLTGLAEQVLTWNILCVDSDGESSFAANNYTLTIDNTLPSVTLNYPDNNIIGNSTVTFNFTASDNNDTSLSCSIYLDGVYNKTVAAQNGVPTTTTISGIPAGAHTWSASCVDDALNNLTSPAKNFIVSFGPVVALTDPADKAVETDGNVDFNFTVYSGDAALKNCSLLINGTIINTLNASQIPHVDDGVENNFSVFGLSEQILNWTVVCFDVNGINGTPPSRNLHVDWTPISAISLNYPSDGETIGVINVPFNFTVFDNVDDVISCSMNFSNSTFNQNSVNATNGVAKIVNINGFYAGTFFWNVTCSDGAFTNISPTYNFTISPLPVINLQSPSQNQALSYNNVNFTYIPQTIAPAFSYCQLVFDGTDNVFSISVTNNLLNWLYNGTLSEGKHNWTIFCQDTDGYNNTASPVRNLTIDLTNPSVYSNYPDGEVIANSTIIFNITAIDNLDNNLSCNLTANSTRVYSNLLAQNNTQTTQSVSGFRDGLFYWNATCSDDSGRSTTSLNKNFTIAEPPSIVLNAPQTGLRTNVQIQLFNFTATDNSGNVSSCELVLNNQANETNNTINGSSIITSTLGSGFYNWSVNCTDPSGYEGKSLTARNITIDITGPNITKHSPYDGETFNQDYINFNWTATDDFGTTIYCNLTLNEQLNKTGIIGTSGVWMNWTVYNMPYGNHNWSVACWDDLNNTNVSNTTSFIINAPDAYIDDSRLYFNNSNPDMYENITIIANITNIGGVPATDFVVDFWNGIPGIGVYLGNSTITIPYADNVTANISWTITPGLHEIWVVVNPGDVKVELDYSNNNATRNISVLISNLTSPANNTWTSDLTPDINFTLIDFNGGLVNYTILVDGVSNGQAGQVNDGDNNILALAPLSQATHYIIVQAKDYLGRIKNSSRIYLNIDATNATANLITRNNTWFNTTTPTIQFNITDNLDANINYSLFVDGSLIVSSNTSNNTNINQTIGPYGQGEHNITIETLDEAGNIRNYSIRIVIDITTPSLTLESPIDGANFTVRTVVLNISGNDNLDDALDCNITLDGSIVSSGLLNNGSWFSYTANNLFEGTHYWNVTCYDNATNMNVSETRTFNVFIAPAVSLLNPQTGAWTNNATSIFYFNVTDDTGIENCSVLINGVVNASKPGSEIILNEPSNISITLGEGFYNWSVLCYDNTSMHVLNASANRTLSVDFTPPIANITTLNETWFNTRTPNITFNLSDNMAGVINYTFYVESLPNTTGTVMNPAFGASALINLSTALLQVVFVQAVDEAGNTINSSEITIYFDDRPPVVTLNSPEDNNITGNDTVTFNFTVTDLRSPLADCNLTIDGVTNVSYYAMTLPNTTVEIVSGLTAGLHNWSVTCVDLAGNVRVSAARNFTVPKPDLIINSGNITFNNSNALERDNVTIFANVFNEGNIPVGSFLARFYSGDPDLGGVQIGSDISIASLAAGGNITVNTTWIGVIGATRLFVVVDPPYLTNGTIAESNETNNKDYVDYLISSYHTVSGNLSGTLEMTNAVYTTMFQWSSGNISGDNLLVSDYDSNPDFFNLQAISRNITNESENDDFADIDTALGSVNFSDSINATYTIGGAPKDTRNFTVFRKKIIDVPIVNSTDNSNFVTGILWDASDGNTHYNGTQDLVFITEVNEKAQGYSGSIADFEIRIPALLRNYQSGDTSRVTFYTELK